MINNSLGVSVYPDIRPMDEIKAYLKTASACGFKRVFSSMFSMPGSKNKVLQVFRDLISSAHSFGMTVSLDVNPEFMKKIGASEQDLSIFHDMGLDILRMDMSYGLARDLMLVNNPYDIKIEFNASLIDGGYIQQLISQGADSERIMVCHNFYPQRYTAQKWDRFVRENESFKAAGVRIGAFLSSQEAGTYGVWGAHDGLPSVERLRDLSCSLQAREMEAAGITDFLFGNACASKTEMNQVKAALTPVKPDEYSPSAVILKSLGFKFSGLVQRKIQIAACPEISQEEREDLFEFFPHMDIGDSSEWIWRSRAPRFIYSGSDHAIPVRKDSRKEFLPGDVVIVNDAYKHYAGEVQIVLKPLVNDGTRNLAGHINADEMQMMELIRDREAVVFMPEE